MPPTFPKPPKIDLAAVARAEAALAAMSVNLQPWLEKEVTRLDAAMSAVRSKGRSAETMDALYHRAHDLKGLGTTYGYPIISQIAGTLCRLIDTPERRMAAPLELALAHVEAIKAAARDQIKTEDDAIGRALVMELADKVENFNPGK